MPLGRAVENSVASSSAPVKKAPAREPFLYSGVIFSAVFRHNFFSLMFLKQNRKVKTLRFCLVYFLYIKQKGHDVAVLHYIIFAFGTNLSGFFAGLLSA